MNYVHIASDESLLALGPATAPPVVLACRPRLSARRHCDAVSRQLGRRLPPSTCAADGGRSTVSDMRGGCGCGSAHRTGTISRRAALAAAGSTVLGAGLLG